jgi:hypothetical protein
LFSQRFWAGIQDGSITVTFRRWKRQQVLAGRRYRTPAGIIEVDAVKPVDPARITNADARRAGFVSADALRSELRGDDTMATYRIAFRAVHDPDPRSELAADSTLSADDVAAIDKRLDRLDAASSHGPWTAAVLAVIRDRPATRAPDLAASFGRETQPFKTDVRKLKNLGLTISLKVGYELSPRGAAYLASTARPLPGQHGA